MLRKIWKWFKRIVLGTLALAVIAVIAVVIILHTDWGREQVRKRVEAVLQGQFPGGAHLGKLSGSIFGTLTIENIELDGADGKPLIRVGQLDVRAEILPLLTKTVRVDSVVAQDVVIEWRAQPSKPETPATEPSQPTPWSIDLRGIEVHRGHLALEGKPLTIDGLELGASFALPSGAPLALTASLHAMWVERKAPINATVSFQLDGGIPVVPSGSITVGGVSLTATSVRGESGTIVVRGSAEALEALEPRATLPGDLLIEIAADANHRVDINGAIGPTPIEGSVQLDKSPFRARGTIGTHDVDLGTITRGKLDGTGSAVVTFVTNGKEVHATVIAIPRVATIPADTIVLNVDGTAAGGHVVAFVTGPGDLRALAAADVTPTRVTRSHLVASLDDPSFFAPGLTGAVRASLTASGAFATLAFTGTANGRAVRFGDASVGALRASFSGRMAKPRPYGIAHVELTGIANAGAPFGNAIVDAKDDTNGVIALTVHAEPRPEVVADLDATLVQHGSALSVDLGNHRVNLPTMLWSGQGGHVDVLPERIVLTDLHTSAGQGGVDIAATYRKADKDLVASVALTQIELEELVPTITGHVDGTVSLEKRGAKWSGKGDLTGTGIVARQDLLPADGELHFDLANKRLTAKATAQNASVGGTEIDLDVTGPVNPFDMAAWKRVPRADIHRIALALHKLTPGAVDARASGTIDGELALTPTDSKGTFEIKSVALPREMGMVDVDMTIVPAPGGELGLVAQAHLADVGTVDIGSRLAMPDALFDVPSWLALGRNALKSFSAQIDEVEVTPAMLARFHVDAPYHGRAMVQLAVGPGGETIKLGADVAGLLGGPIVKALDVHADLTTGPDGTSAFMNTSGNMRELLSISGEAPVTTDQWISGGWDKAKLATLTGKLEIPSASAVDLLAIIGRTHLTKGTLEGAATIGGTLGTPTAQLKLAAHDVAVSASLGDRAPPVLQELVVTGTWGGAAGTVDITGTEVGGGLLHVTATGEPLALAKAVARIDITKLDLVPIAAFLPAPYVSLAGVVDGNVDITGFDSADAKLKGKLTIAKGRIPISPTIGTLQNTDLVMTLRERQVEVVLDADLGVNHDPVRNVHADATGDLSALTITGRLHQVSPINAIQPIIDANIVAKLKHDKQWTGTIEVRNGHIFVPKTKGTKLLSASTPDDLVFVDKPTPIAKTFIRPAPENPTVAVHVDLHSTLIEVEDIARTSITGQLDVSLGGGGIGLLGSIDASGSTDLFDRHYDIDHGSVSFDGTMDGLLNVRLVHDFADLTLTADIGGRVSNPQIELSSEPSTYTRGQLLGFLLGGEPGGDTSSQTQDAAESAATSVASALVGAKVRKVVKFVDVLRCEATSTSSSCTVGVWLDNNKLFVTYKNNLQARPDENHNEGEAQYYLKRSILLDLIAGDQSYHSLDILWRIHW